MHKSLSAKSVSLILVCLLSCFHLEGLAQVRNYQPFVLKTYSRLPLIGLTSGPKTVIAINGRAFLEGDIYVGDTADLNRYQFMQFSVTIDANANKWRNGIVPYTFQTGLSTTERNSIIDAMNHIMEKTNVRFIQRTDEASFLVFRKMTVADLGFTGGYSSIGRQDSNGQFVSFSEDNFTAALAIHEICHALGLYHEQSREDRDTHIIINTQNILPGLEGNFSKQTVNASDFGSYDFSSIMHYNCTVFGRNGSRTIVRRSNTSDCTFGFYNSSRLSAGDISGINNLYPTEQGNYVIPYTGTGVIRDELGIGESKTFTVYAREPYNFPKIYLRADRRYSFSVTSPGWNNGSTATTAAGYDKGLLDAPRQGDYKMMELTGELFSKNGDGMSYLQTHFRIGTSRTWTATRSGYLACFANDNLLFYGDNSGNVNVTIRRLE